jgi:hypothetical protein
MTDLELLVKRFLTPGLEKATAAALTAAYETLIASYASSGTPITLEDRKRFQTEVLDAYYLFYGIVKYNEPYAREFDSLLDDDIPSIEKS